MQYSKQQKKLSNCTHILIGQFNQLAVFVVTVSYKVKRVLLLVINVFPLVKSKFSTINSSAKAGPICSSFSTTLSSMEDTPVFFLSSCKLHNLKSLLLIVGTACLLLSDPLPLSFLRCWLLQYWHHYRNEGILDFYDSSSFPVLDCSH